MLTGGFLRGFRYHAGWWDAMGRGAEDELVDFDEVGKGLRPLPARLAPGRGGQQDGAPPRRIPSI